MERVVWAFLPTVGTETCAVWVWGEDRFPDRVWFDGQPARVAFRERNPRRPGDGRPDWFVRFQFDAPFERRRALSVAA